MLIRNNPPPTADTVPSFSIVLDHTASKVLSVVKLIGYAEKKQKRSAVDYQGKMSFDLPKKDTSVFYHQYIETKKMKLYCSL